MMTGDGLLSCGVGQRLSGVLIRGELAIGAQLRAAKLHMRVVGVKRALGPALSFFFKLRSTAHRCRPVELWATHCVVQAQRQSQGCWPRTPSVARERAFRSRFTAQLTVSFRALRSVARAHLYRLRL